MPEKYFNLLINLHPLSWIYFFSKAGGMKWRRSYFLIVGFRISIGYQFLNVYKRLEMGRKIFKIFSWVIFTNN
jgi:hypothetical protein